MLALRQKDRFYEYAGRILVFGYAFVLLTFACLGPRWYAEIDTNMLSTISIQYSGSLVIHQSDIDQAKIDFPDLYEDVNGFDDLRSSKLIVISEEDWFPYYFPIYPALCIPVKLLFDFLTLDQSRAFLVTNALLISGALIFLQFKLKASPLQRIAAVLMLAFSPIIYYNNFINYEAFIFSVVLVSLVLYYNGNRNLSALFLSLGAMANSTVAAAGLVMIADYLFRMLWSNREQSLRTLIQRHWKETSLYAVCFVPCLIPFAAQAYYLQESAFGELATTSELGSRFLTYLFDPTLGFTLFAPLQLLAFFAIAAVAIIKKRHQAITWFAMFIAVIGAYSLMPHINCGMLSCSRYVIWTYPICPIFIVTYGYKIFKAKAVAGVLYSSCVVSSFLLMLANPLQSAQYFTQTSAWLLKNVPALYNPYAATFYCRTLHVDGGYGYTEPAYYKDDVTGQIYKFIYKADLGQAESILENLKGDTDSMAYLKNKLDEIGVDGEYHYLNFPQMGKYTLYEKDLAEKLNLTENSTLLEASDFSLSVSEGYNIYSAPIVIRPDTYYKVQLILPDTFKGDEYSFLYVDFYGGDGYDNIQQQGEISLIDNNYDNVFYFNSGTFSEETKNVHVRIVSSEGQPVQVDLLRVTELQ